MFSFVAPASAQGYWDCYYTSVSDSKGVFSRHRVCHWYEFSWVGGDDPGPIYNQGGPGNFDPNPGENQVVRDASESDCKGKSANPVVLGTGNKIEPELDFAGVGEMGLHLRRTYNHHWNHYGLFGKHWLSNFDYSLVPQGTNLLWAQRPDGRRIKFIAAGNNRWNEDKAQHVAYIIKHPDNSYTHYTEEQTVERYNNFGYALEIMNRQGVGWTFTYAGNYL